MRALSPTSHGDTSRAQETRAITRSAPKKILTFPENILQES
jgi:hypothetical protein